MGSSELPNADTADSVTHGSVLPAPENTSSEELPEFDRRLCTHQRFDLQREGATQLHSMNFDAAVPLDQAHSPPSSPVLEISTSDAYADWLSPQPSPGVVFSPKEGRDSRLSQWRPAGESHAQAVLQEKVPPLLRTNRLSPSEIEQVPAAALAVAAGMCRLFLGSSS